MMTLLATTHMTRSLGDLPAYHCCFMSYWKDHVYIEALQTIMILQSCILEIYHRHQCAAITASTFFGLRLSTRCQKIRDLLPFIGWKGLARTLWSTSSQRCWMGLKSELCAAKSSYFTPQWENLSLWTWLGAWGQGWVFLKLLPQSQKVTIV